MEEDQSSVILGTTTTIKTLVDGTFRVSIDISPADAQAAFKMLGHPGTPVAIARIMPEVSLKQAREETIERAKGGPLAKLAGQFCDAEPFRQWLRIDYEPLPRTAADAAEIVRKVCGVGSRAELDHDAAAANIFHAKFRLPYNAWVKEGMP